MNSRLLAVSGLFLVLCVIAWFLASRPAALIDANAVEEALASGISLYEQKQYDEALQALQRVPAGASQEARARYYVGSAHMMLKDYESAARELERSLALNPTDVGTLYGLGVAYFKLGNLKLSKSYFAAVLEINPNDEHAKGLMDIMSGLERQSVAAPAPESEEETDN